MPQSTSRDCRVEMILNRHLKGDELTDDRGRKAPVEAIEKELPPDLEPRYEKQRNIDQQVPDSGREQARGVPAEQAGAKNTPGKESVMRGHGLRAEREEHSADSQHKQVPQHGLAKLMSLRQCQFHEYSVCLQAREAVLTRRRPASRTDGQPVSTMLRTSWL